MPDPKNYQDEDSWMKACVPVLKEEGKEQDQAVAQCMNMWKKRELKNTDGKREVRVLPVSEFRFNDEGEKPKFEGYAAVFNRWSEDLGGFRERIKPSAFRDAIKRSDVRALFNHDANYVLGRSTSGTLELKEDKRGLHISNDPPDTQWAKDLMTSVNRGDISQMSFGFTVGEDEWNEDKDGMVSRTINKIDHLFDISVVTYPAYPDTSVALRSLEKMKGEEKPIFTHVESKNIEPELTRQNISELKEIAEKLNTFLAGLEDTPKAEPMQGDGENIDKTVKAEDVDSVDKGETSEGEVSEPMQGEDEVRNYWKNN